MTVVLENVGTIRANPHALQRPDGCPANLHNVYTGSTAFLLCAGPSVKQIDLTHLSNRGFLVAAVNNAGTVLRPHLWFALDPPKRFSEAIWKDPAIQKFVPVQHLDGRLRTRDLRGKLVPTEAQARDMPNVFGYVSNTSFSARDWLSEETINCGQEGDEPDELGCVGVRSVMLVALKLLYVLGIRTVFLLGCDFRMTCGAANYAFPQARTRRDVRMNNRAYRVLSIRLRALKPSFEQAGYTVLNCTSGSGLNVFEHVPLQRALEIATESFPSINTEAMYD